MRYCYSLYLLGPFERGAHQPDDDIVGKRADRQALQLLRRIQSQVKHGRRSARNFAALSFECGQVEQSNSSGLQIDTRWQGTVKRKLIVVEEVVLLDWPPCLGISECQPRRAAVRIGDDQFA